MQASRRYSCRVSAAGEARSSVSGPSALHQSYSLFAVIEFTFRGSRVRFSRPECWQWWPTCQLQVGLRPGEYRVEDVERGAFDALLDQPVTGHEQGTAPLAGGGAVAAEAPRGTRCRTTRRSAWYRSAVHPGRGRSGGTRSHGIERGPGGAARSPDPCCPWPSPDLPRRCAVQRASSGVREDRSGHCDRLGLGQSDPQLVCTVRVERPGPAAFRTTTSEQRVPSSVRRPSNTIRLTSFWCCITAGVSMCAVSFVGWRRPARLRVHQAGRLRHRCVGRVGSNAPGDVCSYAARLVCF